jgi:hypothetical protein
VQRQREHLRKVRQRQLLAERRCDSFA